MEEWQGVEHHEAMDLGVALNPELSTNLPPELIDEVVEKVWITETLPVVLGRREEMKEGQVVKEHRQAMNQDDKSNPKFWENLPNDLIDVIVERVLFGLPFSRVLSFCVVCKSWRDILVSMEYLVYFPNLHDCMILNPRSGLWESMPLLFSQADALKLQDMKLVSCVGGLMCFATGVRDEFIVCNPLTRRCRTLRGPNAARRRMTCDDANLRTRKSYPSGWRVLFNRELQDPLSQYIVVKISASSETAFFDLLVTKRFWYGRPSVRLHVMDSRRGAWVRVPDVHKDFCFVVFQTIIWSEARLMLGLCACAAGFNILFYDTKEQRCIWCFNVRSIETIVGTNLEAQFATLNDRGQWEFLEFRDGRLTLGSAPFPPPTEGSLWGGQLSWEALADLTPMLGFSEILNFVKVQQGDIVFRIRLFRQLPRGQVHISVLTYNVVDGSERISNWIECRPSTWVYSQLPSSGNFFFFKPSFSVP